MQNDQFYTLDGYRRRSRESVSPAIEDYLEMICRYADKENRIRVGALASSLHVTASASSKMAHKLKEQGYVDFEPYGRIRLTPKGRELGEYLLYRHELLNRFFCRINQSENELELVEKIEHFMDRNTIEHIAAFLQKQPFL